MTDQQAIKACLDGDRHAYRHLVESYQEMAVKTAYRFLHDWDDARDAAQESFIKAYRSLDSFRAGNRFSTWYYRILVNHCTDQVRSARFKKSVRLSDRPILSDNPGADVELEGKDLLDRALRILPAKRKQAFVLMDLEGRTSKDAARILGTAESTVRVNRKKAKEQLRKIVLKLIQ